MSKIPLTLVGSERLRALVKQLKTVDRPRIIEAIAVARAHGDLSENAEYHAAKEEQSFTEGRIAQIDTQLADAHIIDVTELDTDGRIVFGATVDLLNLQNDKEVTYQIVGDLEADIKESRISITSPIARALIGKTDGDVATVVAPGGDIDYEILDVRYV